MAAKKILVLSPHLDDAVLSCSDYCLEKKQEGFEILVINIFTKFGQLNYLSSDAISYIHASKANNPQQFEKKRKEEDRKAMASLSFSYMNLDFVDGGFRSDNKKPVYSTYKQLFSKQLANFDSKLIESLKLKIENYDNDSYKEILVPLGIGNHADHLIVKKTAENIFNKKKIKYYLDQPYSLHIKNWHLNQIHRILKNYHTIKFTSNQKKRALRLYESQIKLLFKPIQRKLLFIPEIIL